MALEKLKTKGTLSDKAYEALKENILSLDLKPGEVLLEDSLSDMLGISRTPIREALKKLSYEGLVSYLNGRGTYVTELNTEYFLNIYDIRLSLETLSIRLACKNKTDDDILQLRNLIKKQNEIVNKDVLDNRYYLEIDTKIHMTIARISRNDVLIKYLNEIYESYKRYLYFTNFESRALTVTDEHTKIINSIESGKVEDAVQSMERHLEGVKDSIYSALIKAGKK
ncbi:GntR family transcriptional regulator [Gudongella sp. DL1XJH-153]|uniref:GntR family transcriptional regulator n=1 Tax=Gudongella sp. DL1XJH-153 TaxID=3409804 RepID=UPI003BB4C72F